MQYEKKNLFKRNVDYYKFSSCHFYHVGSVTKTSKASELLLAADREQLQSDQRVVV
jgi:hypothetical protein